MRPGHFQFLKLLFLAAGFLLAACGGMAEEMAATATQMPAEVEAIEVTRVVSEVVEEPAATAPLVRTPVPAPASPLPPTSTPLATGTVVARATATIGQTPIAQTTAIEPVATVSRPAVEPSPLATGAAPTPVVEERVAEVEWPQRMHLGDSDVVRLSVLPVAGGLIVSTEFPDHRTMTETVALSQPSGYELVVAARLDGLGFKISPAGERRQSWLPEEPLTWRWAISPERSGQQRLVVNLVSYWLVQSGNIEPERQSIVFSRGLDVRVTTLLGLTSRQLIMTGIVGFFLGVVLNFPLFRTWRQGRPVRSLEPNERLAIEPHPNIVLAPAEVRLLQALFGHYARLVLELEFRSGYSGARTFLARPILADGRADAYTIAKIGELSAIGREYGNYKAFVEHTLPPITARIQDRPVTAGRRPLFPGRKKSFEPASLRYTFIGEPGQKPLSLRERLLAEADTALLEKLFRTFGPNWWMQRKPYTFRLAQEYDRKLPSHYILEPARGKGQLFDGRLAPGDAQWGVGDLVKLHRFEVVERKAGGRQLSLRGLAQPGQAPLRLRWLSSANPEGATAKVVATRWGLLGEWTAAFRRYDLPDPLEALPDLLNEQVTGNQSIIHGDLNLENILVGPGDFVWLIDFARTREGHPLTDFAHLATEVVAHILTPQIDSDAEYLVLLSDGGGPILSTLTAIARRCSFDADQPREYRLAWYISCLGALKYGNLDTRAKARLYLTAAYLVRSL